MMAEQVEVRFTLNGTVRSCEVPVRSSLADALRDEFRLTGTHLGCEHGVCGSCTVLVDDESVRSCIMLAAQAHGRSVRTVEGLSPADGGLSPLQGALAEAGGLQCGFCTPGFVVAATEIIESGEEPDEAAVREALSGNSCRCTGYAGIVSAVQAVAAQSGGTRADHHAGPGLMDPAAGPGAPGGLPVDRPAEPPTGSIADRWDVATPSPHPSGAGEGPEGPRLDGVVASIREVTPVWRLVTAVAVLSTGLFVVRSQRRRRRVRRGGP